MVGAVGKKARVTKKEKRLNLVRRLTKNAAIAANRSHLLKSLKVTDILNKTIFKATIIFNSLNMTLLAIQSSPIKRAVGDFIKDFGHLSTSNQQLVLKGFKVKSRSFIFNLLTGEVRKGYINQLVADIKR